MEIIICDDNKVFLDELKAVLNKNSKVRKVRTYSKPDELLNNIKEKKIEPDLIFMDIELGPYGKGMDYGKEIFMLNPKIQIVFCTGYHDRYDQEIFLYDLNLAGYLTKPVNEQILEQYIDKIYREINGNMKLRFSVRGKDYVMPVGELVYLESSNHKTIVHTDSEAFNVYEKLGDIQNRLPDSFIHCHKSFLVNMDKIKFIENTSVYINEELSIPVSRAHMDDVKRRYFDYIGEQL